jgi:hypothetical protein
MNAPLYDLDMPDLTPTDVEILDALVEQFDLTPAEMIERLICVDFVALRKEALNG